MKVLPRLILLLLLMNSLFADLNLNRHALYIGPEWFHVERTKSGGTKQHGDIYGGRLGYDRLKRYGWYWGGDAYYASGDLKGHTGSGANLKSRFKDWSLEGRFGYTFQYKCGLQPSITPFIGVGYFEEKNNFVDPSPIVAHFKIRAYYTVIGFLSSLYYDPFEVGLNFKAKWPFDPRCKVTHDEDNLPMTQNITARWFYRVELPITFRFKPCSPAFAISGVPFYEFRNYGKHPNFPFNFIKTQFNNWGLRIEFQLQL